jgi:tetratricopeptide (TPR) repeat protein
VQKTLLLVLLVFFLCFETLPAIASSSTKGASDLLRQARETDEASRKLELLDEALKIPPSSKGLLGNIYFERGQAHKEMKDYLAAINDFNICMAHAPGMIQALLEKAECLIELDRLDEASQVLEKVLAVKPGIARSYVLKAIVYEKQGFPTKAEDEYTRALHYNPHSPLALEMRAKALLRSGKPRQALADISILGRIERHRHDIFRLRAGIHVKLKDYAAALGDYAVVESLMGGDEAIIKEKAQVLFLADQPRKALQALEGYLVRHPSDIEALVLRARAHILLKNESQAERLLSDVLAMAPVDATAHLYLGVIAMRRQQWDHALAALNRSIELNPSLAEAYKERARVFMKLDEPTRAIDDLTSTADLDPSDGEIFALRGLAKMKRLLFDAAVADFSQALQSLPGNPRILYDRATAQFHRDDPEAALADLNTVLAANAQLARALSLRGVIHYHRGAFSDARRDLDQAIKADPKDATVWNNRGFFMYKTGEYKAALGDLSKALELDPHYDMARYNLSLVRAKIEESAGQASLPRQTESVK